MKTKYNLAEEYALSEGDNGSAEISFLAGYSAAEKGYEERIKSLEDKLKLAEWALLVYANKEHLFGPFAESEPGYIRGKQVTVCRHIGQTAMEALAIIRGEK